MIPGRKDTSNNSSYLYSLLRSLRWQYGVWIVVLVLIWWVLRSVNWSQTLAALSRLQPMQLGMLAFVNLFVLATFAGRLWLLLHAQGYSVSFLTLIRYWLAAFAVSFFTPGPQFGGGPVQIYFLYDRDGMPADAATAAVVTSKVLERIGNATFLAIGAVILVRLSLLSDPVNEGMSLLILLLSAVPIVYLAATWYGWHPVTEILNVAPNSIKRQDLYRRLSGTIQDAEVLITRLCRDAPLTLLLGTGVSLLSWVAVGLETWYALSFLGVQATVLEVISILTIAQLAFLSSVPGGVGAMDAGFVIAFQHLGYPPAAGVALALLVHARDVIIGGIGLLLGGHLAFTADVSFDPGTSPQEEAADLS